MESEPKKMIGYRGPERESRRGGRAFVVIHRFVRKFYSKPCDPRQGAVSAALVPLSPWNSIAILALKLFECWPVTTWHSQRITLTKRSNERRHFAVICRVPRLWSTWWFIVRPWVLIRGLLAQGVLFLFTETDIERIR